MYFMCSVTIYALVLNTIVRAFQYWSSVEQRSGSKLTSFSSVVSCVSSSPAALINASFDVCGFSSWLILLRMRRPSLARAAVGCFTIMRGAVVESSKGCSCVRTHSGMVLINALSVALKSISFLQMLQCKAKVSMLSNMGGILSFMSVKKPFDVDCAANWTGMSQRLSTPFRS